MHAGRVFRFAAQMIVFLALVAVGQAQEDSIIPTVAITATEDGVDISDDFSTGLTTLHFQNETDQPFSPLFVRLNDDVSLDDFMTAMQGNPAAVLAMVTLFGGLDTPPGESRGISLDLTAGEYLLLNFASETPDIQSFSIAEGEAETREAPEADVVITLVDFAFALPDNLESGPQLWQIVNDGEQPHEIGIFRVDEGSSLEEVKVQLMESMMSEDIEMAEPAFEAALFWSPMSPQTQAWVEVDLEPGTYVAVCFIPNFISEDMLPHLEHGMIKLVTVRA